MAPATPNVPTIEQRMANLLALIATEIRDCRACGRKLYFVRHSNGKLAPYTIEGVNHFIDCANAAQFKRGRS